ncbi:MAG: SPASM domain-containing protein, partial [Schwartzia sp.]|nr:SPASM domain-containing protein [Schwartzia sp. (in: firmicutes)]
SVGYVEPSLGRFLWNFNKAKWRVRTTDSMEACRACPYAFICRGGCASRAKYEHGSFFREYCDEVKEIFAFVASRTAGEKWEKNHDEEMTLSLAGPLSRLTAAERGDRHDDEEPKGNVRDRE